MRGEYLNSSNNSQTAQARNLKSLTPARAVSETNVRRVPTSRSGASSTNQEYYRRCGALASLLISFQPLKSLSENLAGQLAAISESFVSDHATEHGDRRVDQGIHLSRALCYTPG